MTITTLVNVKAYVVIAKSITDAYVDICKV